MLSGVRLLLWEKELELQTVDAWIQGERVHPNLPSTHTLWLVWWCKLVILLVSQGCKTQRPSSFPSGNWRAPWFFYARFVPKLENFPRLHWILKNPWGSEEMKVDAADVEDFIANMYEAPAVEGWRATLTPWHHHQTLIWSGGILFVLLGRWRWWSGSGLLWPPVGSKNCSYENIHRNREYFACIFC